jgi:hypothetical protein
MDGDWERNSARNDAHRTRATRTHADNEGFYPPIVRVVRVRFLIQLFLLADGLANQFISQTA